MREFNDEFVFISVYVVGMMLATFVGWRSTLISWRRHQRIGDYLTGTIRLLSFAHVVIRAAITIAATWFGYLAIRRILGFIPPDWSPPISLTMAIIVLMLPSYLDWVERRIASDPTIPLPDFDQPRGNTAGGPVSADGGFDSPLQESPGVVVDLPEQRSASPVEGEPDGRLGQT